MILCRKCLEEKEEIEFNKSMLVKPYKVCRKCTLSYSRAHYALNKKTYIKNSIALGQAARERNRSFIKAYLLEHPCVDCGEPDPIVLEFDHTAEKSGNISDMVHRGSSLQTIEQEIAKCEVVCANCHRRRTAARAKWKA